MNRTKKNKSFRNKFNKRKIAGGKTGKKWITAIEAAQKTLKKTGSLEKAKKSLRKQALTNARKLFGSLSN
jgi:hypothetical protein